MIKIDIAVTIPKKEYKNDDQETLDYITQKVDYQFWTLGRVPKKLNIGDRVYFIRDNKIESSMKVLKIIKNSSLKCETTNRLWSGKCQIMMNDLRYENINMVVKGFQGFRYKWWEG